ncbi:MAG TPA: response regulator, partial [Acidimicrobiales bacterium]
MPDHHAARMSTPTAADPAVPAAPVVAPGPSATRVLLVEDDPNIVDLIRSNLLVRGYQVDVSRTGVDVLPLDEDRAPDVVLLDLMLPGADGFELCRALRE